VVAGTIPDNVVYKPLEWFAGGVWESLEKESRESLEGCKQKSTDSGETQQTRMFTKTPIEKARLMKFQLENMALLGIGPTAVLFTMWQRILSHYVHALRPCEAV
jgi:hypothetical protein